MATPPKYIVELNHSQRYILAPQQIYVIMKLTQVRKYKFLTSETFQILGARYSGHRGQAGS